MKRAIVVCVALASVAVSSGLSHGAGPAEWVGDLSPIAPGDWSYGRAAHLLERAGFGGTPREIQRLADMTPEEAVDYLIDYESIDNSHLEPFDESGLYEIFGEGGGPIELELADAGRNLRRYGRALGFETDGTDGSARSAQRGGGMGMGNIMGPLGQRAYFHVGGERMEMYRLERWWAGRMLNTRRPLEEKMTFFWHGHFAASDRKLFDYRKLLLQWEMLRRNATGNFHVLLLGIAKDPAMLTFLDNRKNVKGDPNENFAREVMELFSMGVGNYTERDIREAARAFTGWTLDPLNELVFVVNAEDHDTADKTLFGHTGNFDGEDIIGLIVDHAATPRYISWKLYRFFVREDVSPKVHDAIAAKLRDLDFELKPFLKTLFLSKDFYSSAGTQVKSPIQLVISTYKKLGMDEVPTYPNFREVTYSLGQELGSPPNVAGWKSGRTWINPATLLERGNFVRDVLFPDPENAELSVAGTMGASMSKVTPELVALYDNVERVWIHTYSFEYLSTHAELMAKTPEFSNMKEGRESRASRTRGGAQGGLYPNIWKGNLQAREFIKKDPESIPEIDLIGMVRESGSDNVEEIFDHLTQRFLRVELDPNRRAPLVNYFEELTGSDTLDLKVPYNRDELENKLRKVVHMIMSLAEYQMA